MSPKTRTGVDVYVDGTLKWRNATVTNQFGILAIRADGAEVLRLTDTEEQARKKSNAWTWRGQAASDEPGAVATLTEVTAIQKGGCGCGKRR